MEEEGCHGHLHSLAGGRGDACAMWTQYHDPGMISFNPLPVWAHLAARLPTPPGRLASQPASQLAITVRQKGTVGASSQANNTVVEFIYGASKHAFARLFFAEYITSCNRARDIGLRDIATQKEKNHQREPNIHYLFQPSPSPPPCPCPIIMLFSCTFLRHNLRVAWSPASSKEIK